MQEQFSSAKAASGSRNAVDGELSYPGRQDANRLSRANSLAQIFATGQSWAHVGSRVPLNWSISGAAEEFKLWHSPCIREAREVCRAKQRCGTEKLGLSQTGQKPREQTDYNEAQ